MRRHLRRLARARPRAGKGSARFFEARRQTLLRLPRGPGPRRLLRGHYARGVRRERAAHRALPGRQPPRVCRRADRGNAGGRRRAGLRARGTAEGAHRHHQLARRQAARRVLPRSVRRRRRVLPRGDRGRGERAHHSRGTHRERQRVRLEPRHRRARSGSAAQLPHALLRHHHLHPARGDRARTARGRRGHGGVAHGQARLGPRRQGALLRPAEGGEGRPSDHGRDQRAPRSHALQGAHELRRQAHQQRPSAAGERPGLGRAAHAHRVLRHLHHPRLLHGGLHGGVHRRKAGQEPVPPLQDKDAARRGQRLPFHAGGDAAPLRAGALERRALRQQAGPHHPGWRKAAADGGARHVRGDGDRRHRHLRSGQARRGAVRALAGHGTGGAALRLGVAVSGEAGARRGPPLRHHLPPRAARQGHDGEHSGRRGGTGPRAEEGADEALQVVQEPEGREPRGHQGRQGHPRRGGRGAGARSRAV